MFMLPLNSLLWLWFGEIFSQTLDTKKYVIIVSDCDKWTCSLFMSGETMAVELQFFTE
jgi:hypothetical protein